MARVRVKPGMETHESGGFGDRPASSCSENSSMPRVVGQQAHDWPGLILAVSRIPGILPHETPPGFPAALGFRGIAVDFQGTAL